MPQLQWYKTKTENERTLVFDPLRKKYVALTPEEEVRQQILHYLVENLSVPAGLLAVEYSIQVNGLDKRCDAVVFSNDMQPLMIVECKAKNVKITQKTLDQTVRYYSALQPRFLCFSMVRIVFASKCRIMSCKSWIICLIIRK